MSYNFDEMVSRENTYSVKYDGRKKYFGSTDLIPMWVADMDFKTPSFVTDAVKQRAEQAIYGYSFRPDLYFDSIISWFSRRHYWIIERDWINFTPGIVPALNILIQTFTSEKDKILVQPPVYHPFFSAIENNQRELVINPLVLDNGKYKMNFQDLDMKLAQGVKMVLFSNPHNPVGRAWKPEELISFGNLCQKHNVLIVSDEIHCDLVLPTFKHTPLAKVFEEYSEKIITCVAPSKTFNLAGLATSSILIENEKIREQYTEMIEKLHIGMGNLFGTTASIAAYTKGDNWLDQLMIYIQENVDFVQNFLEKRIPSVHLIQPEATYLLWLDFRDLKMKKSSLKEFMIETAKLGFNDGSTFRNGGDGFQRMNVACPKETVHNALIRLENAVNQLKS